MEVLRAQAVVATAVAVALVGPVLTSCAGEVPDAQVAPLTGDTRAPSETAPTTARDGPSRRSDEIADGPSGQGLAAGDSAVPGPEGEVTSLLVEYDRALGELVAHPAAAADETDPLTVAWHRIVEPGSALDVEVRTRIATDGRDNHMRIVAGEEGFAFRNLPLAVSADVDGSVAWTNCGFSPGIGVHIDTGAVIDDRRASTRGRGRATRSHSGALVITELFDDRTDLLRDDEPDPCPALSEATEAEATSAQEGS